MLQTDGANNLIKDTNLNELIRFTATASAVNDITVANAATGNAPAISATGDDTNTDLQLSGKGTGKAKLGDTGTASATAGAATCSTQRGTITSEALTTAALATYTLTLTNTKVSTTSQVLVSPDNGTNTQGELSIQRVTPGAGSVVILLKNTHTSQAYNGTVKFNFVVF